MFDFPFYDDTIMGTIVFLYFDGPLVRDFPLFAK